MAISTRKEEKAGARGANHDVNKFPPTKPLTRSKADRKNIDCYFFCNLYAHKKGICHHLFPFKKSSSKNFRYFIPLKNDVRFDPL